MDDKNPSVLALTEESLQNSSLLRPILARRLSSHPIVMKFMIELLCVPVLFRISSYFYIMSTSDSSNQSMLTKAESIISNALSLLSDEQQLEPSREMRRVALFFEMMKYRLGDFSDILRDFGTDGLEMLTLQMLGVRSTSSVITNSVKTVIYRLLDGIKSKLGQKELDYFVSDYFDWVATNSAELIMLCRKEELHLCVDPSVRAWMRSETYSSAHDILRVYDSKYRKVLSRISIPITCPPFRSIDIDQAKRDICRENISVNGEVFVAMGGDILTSLIHRIDKEVASLPIDETVISREDVKCHLLLGASRTIASGDAYFLLHDLYSSPDTCLVALSAANALVNSTHHLVAIHFQEDEATVTVTEYFSLHINSPADSPPLVSFRCVTQTEVRHSVVSRFVSIKPFISSRASHF